MRVVLIPCSGRKRDGGSTAPHSFLQQSLSAEHWQNLCAVRAALAEMLRLEPGPDLGNAPSSSLQLLPAWLRYEGNLYGKAQLSEHDVMRSDTRLFVVSALFGLIDARDTIRRYNLAMIDTLPDGRKVYRFWREHGLLLVVQDLLRNLGARELHDFLSGSYRQALKGLEHSVGCAYCPRAYPGLGTGSDYHRGSELRTFLDTGSGEPTAEGG